MFRKLLKLELFRFVVLTMKRPHYETGNIVDALLASSDSDETPVQPTSSSASVHVPEDDQLPAPAKEKTSAYQFTCFAVPNYILPPGPMDIILGARPPQKLHKNKKRLLTSYS